MNGPIYQESVTISPTGRRKRRGVLLPTKVPKNPELVAALQHRLLALLQKPPTVRSLFAIEQTAQLGRELLAVGADPECYRGSSDGLSVMGSSAENFGTQVLREIMPLVKSLRKPEATTAPERSDEDLIYAIALAREKGLGDVAGRLEAQLLGRLKPANPKSLAAPPRAPEPAEQLSEKDIVSTYSEPDGFAPPRSAQAPGSKRKPNGKSAKEARVR